jgi:hypothetical protein
MPSVARYQPLDKMTREEIFDEYGTLDLAEQQDEPRQERLKVLKAHIIALAEADPASDPVIFDGAEFTLQLTPRAMDRKIKNVEKLYKYVVAKWGVSHLLGMCKFQMAKLDDLPADKRAEFVSETQTGTRRVYAVAKTARRASAVA